MIAWANSWDWMPWFEKYDTSCFGYSGACLLYTSTEARTGGKTEVHDNKLSLKVTRLTREIEQTLNQRQVEPGKALSLILECAAEKYRVCQMGRLDHRTGTVSYTHLFRFRFK